MQRNARVICTVYLLVFFYTEGGNRQNRICLESRTPSWAGLQTLVYMPNIYGKDEPTGKPDLPRWERPRAHTQTLLHLKEYLTINLAFPKKPFYLLPTISQFSALFILDCISTDFLFHHPFGYFVILPPKMNFRLHFLRGAIKNFLS